MPRRLGPAESGQHAIGKGAFGRQLAIDGASGRHVGAGRLRGGDDGADIRAARALAADIEIGEGHRRLHDVRAAIAEDRLFQFGSGLRLV